MFCLYPMEQSSWLGQVISSSAAQETEHVLALGETDGNRNIFLIMDKISSYLNNRLLEIINVVLNGRWRSATISALGLAACSWQSSLARLSNLVFCLRIWNQENLNGCKKDSCALLLQYCSARFILGNLCQIRGLSSYCRETMSW